MNHANRSTNAASIQIIRNDRKMTMHNKPKENISRLKICFNPACYGFFGPLKLRGGGGGWLAESGMIKIL